MAACGVGCMAFAALAFRSFLAVAFLAVSPLLMGSLAQTHFDFWPDLWVVAALAALVYDRHRLGWAALAGAIAIKLFAIVLVPLAVVWTIRRRGLGEVGRCVAVFVVVSALAFGPFLAISPHGLWNSLWDQLSRPLQIETLPAAFLKTFGHPALVGSHGSVNLQGRGNCARGRVRSRSLVWCWSLSGSGSRGARGDRSARPLFRGVRLRVRRRREGALAAVPDLARPARPARSRPKGTSSYPVACCRTRLDTDVVSRPVLLLRLIRSWAWLVLARDLLQFAVLAAMLAVPSLGTRPQSTSRMRSPGRSAATIE